MIFFCSDADSKVDGLGDCPMVPIRAVSFLEIYRKSGDSGMGSSEGKNTSPCPGGDSGVPGSDNR